jgi:3-dehydroquinate synthase
MVLPDHIAFGPEPGALIRSFLAGKSYTRIALAADENTHRLCVPLLPAELQREKILVVPAGERHKNLDTCNRIWNFLTELAFDRHSLLIVVGGGVPGDMAGFCAATYKRGIDFVLMPTTLLAQVDASTGGKLGIDFLHYKNHIGVFKEPAATLISTAFLATLPVRELRSGYAEVIKHSLIADAALWGELKAAHWQESDWLAVVRRSVETKYRIVQQDPHEKGIRKILNFGHTLGHAIESAALEQNTALLHGEAVAAGMVCEAFIASQKGISDAETAAEIARFVFAVFGRPELPADELVWRFIGQDKKNRGGTVLAAMPEKIGKAVWDVPVSADEVTAALRYCRALQM